MKSGTRVDVSEYDDLLVRWYVHEDLSLRATYDRLQAHLDDDEWTTHLAVRYRLQELGLKQPRGHFDALEARLERMDPDAIGTQERSNP